MADALREVVSATGVVRTVFADQQIGAPSGG
jgi:hypothetical protein